MKPAPPPMYKLIGTAGVEIAAGDARCEFCGRVMLGSGTCDPLVLVSATGRLPRVHYGDEPIGGPAGMRGLGYHEGSRCGDCGVLFGGFHHPGCVIEFCPHREQAIGCTECQIGPAT